MGLDEVFISGCFVSLGSGRSGSGREVGFRVASPRVDSVSGNVRAGSPSRIESKDMATTQYESQVPEVPTMFARALRCEE